MLCAVDFSFATLRSAALHFVVIRRARYFRLCCHMLCYVMQCQVVLCYAVVCYDMRWFAMMCFAMVRLATHVCMYACVSVCMLCCVAPSLG